MPPGDQQPRLRQPSGGQIAAGNAQAAATALGTAAIQGANLGAAAATAGISAAITLGITGITWLWRRIKRAPLPEAPKNSEVVQSKRVPARYVIGKRVKTAGKLVYASIVPGPGVRRVNDRRKGWTDNQLRTMHVISEGAIQELRSVEVEGFGLIPLEKVTTGGVTWYEPKAGTGYDLPPADVAWHEFPQRRTMRFFLSNALDGSDLAQFALAAVDTDPGVEIEYDRTDGENNTWHSEPDGTTKRWQTYTLVCGQGMETGGDGLCYDPAMPGGVPQNEGDTNWDQGEAPSQKSIVASGRYDQLPVPFTADHKFVGKSVIVGEYFQPLHQAVDENLRVYTDDDFFSEFPKTKFVVDGIPIPLPDGTSAVTTNPVAIARWYDVTRLGLEAALISSTQYASSYQDCEREITLPASAFPTGRTAIPDRGLNVFRPYQWSGVISSGDDPEAVHTNLAMARHGARETNAAGMIVYTTGKRTAPVATLDADDWIEIADCKPFPDLDGRINIFTALMEQSQLEDHEQSTVSVTDEQALARDGHAREFEAQYEGQSNPEQVHWHLLATAKMMRESLWISGTIGPQADMGQKDWLTGDTLAVSELKRFGLVNRRLAIEEIDKYDDGTARVVVRLEGPDPFVPSLGLTEIVPRGLASTLPRPPEVTGIESEEIAWVQPGGSVAIRLEVSCDPFQQHITRFRIRSKATATEVAGAWIYRESTGRPVRYDDVAEGVTYEIQARYETPGGLLGPWTSGADNTIDGDVTPPGAIVAPTVTFLPGGFQIDGTSPPDADTRIVCVFVARAAGIRATVATLIQSFATAPDSKFSEQYGGYDPGVPLFVKYLAKDSSGNEGPLTPEFQVVPRRFALEGARIHVGEGPPLPELGEDGDLYLERRGTIWYRVSGAWIDSGRPASGDQPFRTFEIDASADAPTPAPPFDAFEGTLAYNLATGQVWERGPIQWIYKGDLTGDPGKPGAGIVSWDADLPPTDNVGIDGDLWRTKDGRWWRKVDGSWELGDGTIGRSGSRVIAIEGNGPPERPSNYRPAAERWDLAFAKGSARFYQLELERGVLVWIEIADLHPNRTFIFVAPQGDAPTSTTLVLPTGTPALRDGDEARNGETGEIWSRAGGAWVLVGDATRAGGISFAEADPPGVDGVIYGDVYVSTTSGKRYVWTERTGAVLPGQVKGEWIHDGYVHASQWIISTAIPNTGIPGDCYLQEGTRDVYCVGADGVVPTNPNLSLQDVDRPSTPTLTSPPGECTIFFTTWPYNPTGNDAFGAVNDGWISIDGEFGTKENNPASTTGRWPAAQRLPGRDVRVYVVNDPDDLGRFFISALQQSTAYAVISGGDDIGEVWLWQIAIRNGRRTGQWIQTDVLLCGTAAVNNYLRPPVFRSSGLTFVVQADRTVRAFIQWSGGNGNGFDVRHRVKGAGNAWQPRPTGYTRIAHATQSSWQIAGLRASTEYEFAIRTVGASGDTSTWVSQSAFTSGIPKALPPTNITGAESQSRDGLVNVDWDNRTGSNWNQVTGLIVRLRSNNATVASKRVSATTESTTFADVRTGNYIAQVAAINPSGTGQYGSSAIFRVLRNPPPDIPTENLGRPPSPSSVTVTISRRNRGVITWTYPSGVSTARLPSAWEARHRIRRNGAIQRFTSWYRVAVGSSARTGLTVGLLSEGIEWLQLRGVNAKTSGASRLTTSFVRNPD